MPSMTKPKIWVDGPCPLLETPFHKLGESPNIVVANKMALTHNIFIRGLNAIILQARGVSDPADARDFLTFCLCWVETLHHHHTVEEDLLFPKIEESLGLPGHMEAEVKQHAALIKGLDAFEGWLKRGLERDGKEYDAAKCLEMVDGLSEVLMGHLEGEVETLIGLRDRDPDGKVMTEVFGKLESQALKSADAYRHHPIAFGCIDVTFEDGKVKFPEVPFFVPYLVDWWMARKYRGAWRFCPSDFHGRPRELQFLPKDKE